MKHRNWMAPAACAALSIWMFGAAWAQTGGVNGTGTAPGKAKPTPVNHGLSGVGSTQPNAQVTPRYPNLHSFSVQLWKQMKQVRKDLKAGKLTQEQAQAVFEKLKAVRVQENRYFGENGQKDITADQKGQLEQMLGQAYGSSPSQ